MNAQDFSDRPATLAQYQAILRRRKWIIISVPIIAASVAYTLSARQSPMYQARASVSIRTTNLANQVAGISGFPGDPNRLLANKADLATSQELASRVAEKAGVPGVSLSAKPEVDADLLDLSVSYRDPQSAARLVNVYAEQFVRYNNDVDTGYVQAALLKVQATIRRLRAQNQTGSTTYDDALTLRDKLQTFGTLLANSATVRTRADGASKIRPKPRRNALIGGLLGAFLGIGLGFLIEALDKRVRSEEEIEAILGIPLLGRVPPPKRRLRKANRLVMLADPVSIHAQTYRRLRTSLEFVNFERRARMIMVTSALPREGKSTTVANLAVALARAGRRVALMDLDLRRPAIHAFFNTGSDHGFTDVVVHRLKLRRALRSIALPSAGRLSEVQSNGDAAFAGWSIQQRPDGCRVCAQRAPCRHDSACRRRVSRELGR